MVYQFLSALCLVLDLMLAAIRVANGFRKHTMLLNLTSLTKLLLICHSICRNENHTKLFKKFVDFCLCMFIEFKWTMDYYTRALRSQQSDKISVIHTDGNSCLLLTAAQKRSWCVRVLPDRLTYVSVTLTLRVGNTTLRCEVCLFKLLDERYFITFFTAGIQRNFAV